MKEIIMMNKNEIVENEMVETERENPSEVESTQPDRNEKPLTTEEKLDIANKQIMDLNVQYMRLLKAYANLLDLYLGNA